MCGGSRSIPLLLVGPADAGSRQVNERQPILEVVVQAGTAASHNQRQTQDRQYFMNAYLGSTIKNALAYPL